MLALFATVFHWDDIDIISHEDDKITFLEFVLLMQFLVRYLANEPLAYILGAVDFYGTTLKVDKKVLIPRQETELLVDIFIKKNYAPGTLLDLCTGSGAIACAIKHNLPQMRVLASDISQEALEIAQKNAQLNNLNIKFFLADFLNFLDKPVDYIICNPPYISRFLKNKLPKSVIDFEPHIALFANDNGLEYYKKLAYAKNSVKKAIFMEVGFDIGQICKEIFINKGWKVELLADLAGHERFLIATH